MATGTLRLGGKRRITTRLSLTVLKSSQIGGHRYYQGTTDSTIQFRLVYIYFQIKWGKTHVGMGKGRYGYFVVLKTVMLDRGMVVHGS